MKILKKLMALIVAAFITFGSYIALPVTKLVALANAGVATTVKISVKDVPTELDLTQNASIDIPAGTVEGHDSVSRIYNGSGRVVFDSTKDAKFTPQAAGKYTIVYGYVENETFVRVSGDYTLNVVGVKPTLTLAENEEFFLPSRVPATNNTVVNIPMPDIVLSDGTTIKAGDNKYTVSEPTVKNVSSSASLTVNRVNNHRTVTISADSVKGKYEVRWTYEDVVLIKYFEVVDAKSIDTTNLNYTATISSWTENAQRYKGEAINLPTLTVKDSSGNNVTNETYNTITVKYIEVSGANKVEQTSAEYFTLDGYKLTLNKNAEEAGSHYEINYTVKDYFGNVVETFDFKITRATSYKNNIKVYAVDNYALDAEADSIVSISNVVPNIFNYEANVKDTIVIPAIYATDDNNSEFTYTRTLRKPGEAASTTIDANANEKTSFTVEKEGTYVLTLTAKSTKTELSSSLTFTIKTYTGENAVTSTPTMTLPVVPQNIKVGETINIDLPTIADKDDNGDVVDERLTLTVSNNLTPVYTNHTLSGYTFTGVATGTQTLTFTATNDNGESVTKSVEITVLGADTIAPTLAINGDAYDQNESVITLPSVTFADTNNDTDEIDTRFTKVYVQVFDPNGNEINGVSGIRYNHITHTVYGGSFIAGLTGKYTIIYTAVDAFNNASSIAIITSEVAGTSKYVQAGLKSEFPTQIEPGEEVTLPEPVIQLNGETKDVDYTLEILSDSGNYTLTASNVFSATSEGQYEFVYMVNGEEVSAHYIITVSDTTAPTLEVDVKNTPDTVVGYEENAPAEIFIPVFNPTDNVKLADYSIKITKNGSEYKTFTKKDLTKIYTDAEAEGRTVTSYSFTPNGNGVYKVEYNATDAAGNKATAYSFEINVGDVDTPVIKFNGTLPATTDVNSTITFKASDIVVTDSSETADYEVSVKDSSGDAVTNTGATGAYSYKLEKAGEYTLTITANDHKGHTETYTKTITVSSEEYDSTVNTTVIGIILIVVSVLILAGVVVFFIKTRDRKPKTETTND